MTSAATTASHHFNRYRTAYAPDVDQKTFADLRVDPRVATSVAVDLYLAGLPGPLSARTADIGTGGLSVQTTSPFALSSLRRVVVSLPFARLDVDARGCWQREVPSAGIHQSGIQFLGLSEAASRLLATFVQKRSAELITFLSQDSSLRDLSLDQIATIALFTRLRDMGAGRWIFRQGTQLPGEDSIFVVTRGRLVLTAQGGRTKELVLGRLEPGAVFGGVPLLAGTPHTVSAVADTEIELLEIDRETFRYLELSNAGAARRLCQVVMRNQVVHLNQLLHQS